MWLTITSFLWPSPPDIDTKLRSGLHDMCNTPTPPMLVDIQQGDELPSKLLYSSLCWNDADMLRWSTHRANDRYKDHLDGQLTMNPPSITFQFNRWISHPQSFHNYCPTPGLRSLTRALQLKQPCRRLFPRRYHLLPQGEDCWEHHHHHHHQHHPCILPSWVVIFGGHLVHVFFTAMQTVLCHDHSLQLPCPQVALHIAAWGPDGKPRYRHKGRCQQYSRWVWNRNLKAQSILDFLDNHPHVKWFWWPMLLFQGEGDIISLRGPPTMEGTPLWKGEEEVERRWGFRISRWKPVQN